MKKKLIIGVVVLLGVGAFAANTMMATKPVDKSKIKGTVYLLPKQFTLNLSDGRYATLNVALLLAPGQSDGATAAGGGTSSDSPVGTLPEEAVIRDIVTNVITNQPSQQLISDNGRQQVKQAILAQIAAHTDIKVAGIYFTDVAVQ
jgi:flagellar basal body-associated protein FliL